jgi:hypothetical protein
MRTITTNVYTFNELSEDAKEKARDWYRKDSEGDCNMLEQHLGNMAGEIMDTKGIGYIPDSIRVIYSLGYCQGDGAMFEGACTYKGNTYRIRHSGRYAHAYSRDITTNKEATDKDVAEFEELYVSICKELERIGYEDIEYRNSAEYIDDMMDANGYEFTIDGKIV